MESLRKRTNVELVNNERRIKKTLAKPTCKNFTIVNEDLVMVQFMPKKIIQNKPMYTAFVVLELSKVLMYEFHYKHIQGQYGADRRGFCSPTQTASAIKFKRKICMRIWQVISSTTTPVRIPKPIPSTIQPTPRSLENLKVKPIPSLPKNLWDSYQKCTV